MVDADVGEVLSLGVDWITLVGTDDGRLGNLLQLGRDLVTFRLRGGFVRKGWGMAGFSGFQSSGVQYGTRNNEVIVRLSGDLAHGGWRHAYALAKNCTRVDLECTSRTDADAHGRIKRAFAAARRHSSRQKGGPAVTYVHCTTGGDTVYLGKRQSMRFGRIYDKGVESGDPHYRNAVRYEVEFKADLASLVMDRLYRQRVDWDACAGEVQAFFGSRGVPLELSTRTPTPMVVPRLHSDHARQLRWIREQCRPTVRRLIECGLAADVTKALGLSPESHLVVHGPIGPYEPS